MSWGLLSRQEIRATDEGMRGVSWGIEIVPVCGSKKLIHFAAPEPSWFWQENSSYSVRRVDTALSKIPCIITSYSL